MEPLRLRTWLRQWLPADRGLALSLLDQALQAKLPMEDLVKAVAARAVPKQAFNYWGWMRLLTSEGKYSRFVPFPRRAVLDFLMSRSGLPSVTNLPLAAMWKRCVEAGRPALVITAEGKLREIFFDRINAGMPVHLDTPSYVHVRLPGTNHIFTTGGAIATVTKHLETNWKLFSAAAAPTCCSSGAARHLWGSTQLDTLSSAGGDDLVETNGGSDSVDCGDGSDIFIGAGAVPVGITCEL